DSVETFYAIQDETTAIIEGATIAGLLQVPLHQRSPYTTLFRSIGEVMQDALTQGCTSFIIGIGGSATNDGGLGMLQALGMQAYDENGEKLGPFGRDVLNIHKVDLQNMDPRLKQVTIQIANDVDNPLCGEHGATYIYGPQKGMTEHQLPQYDNALDYFGTLMEETLQKNFKHFPG